MPEQNHNSLEYLLRNVTNDEETVFDIIKELDESSGETKLSVCLGKRTLQPEPPRTPIHSEPPRRNHVFHDVDSFSAFLGVYQNDNTIVFADSQSGCMQAVMDGSAKPEGQHEVVTLKPLMHPLFAPWNSILDERLTVLTFAQHCMKYRRAVIEPNGRELALLLSQIRADSKTTRHQGEGRHTINGVTVETRIQGTIKEEPVDIPDSITIKCPLFIGSPALDVELDLLVTSKGDDVYVIVTSSLVSESVSEAFREMTKTLVAENPDLMVVMGEADFTDWDYID